MCKWTRAVLLALMPAVFATMIPGCTPLAKTSYPVAWDEGMLGNWRFEFNAALMPPDQEDPAPILLASVSKDSRPQDHPPDVPGAPAEVWPRLRVEVTETNVDEDDQPDPTYTIVGGLIQSAGPLFFSFQQAAGEATPDVGFLHTPLQYTFRVERDGDVMKLWGHRVMLVWTPMEYAGTLQPSLPPADLPDWSRKLVQNYDDIVAYYEKVPGETWVLLGTATRVHTP